MLRGPGSGGGGDMGAVARESVSASSARMILGPLGESRLEPSIHRPLSLRPKMSHLSAKHTQPHSHRQPHSHSQSQSQSLTQRKNLMVSNSARSGAVPLPKARCQTWSFSVVGESITTTAALTFHHANQRPGCAANTTASYTACAPRAHITSGRRPASRT